MKRLVVASTNPGKIREISSILRDHSIATMAEMGFTQEIAETGKTIRDNAVIKATTIRDWLRERGIDADVLADDSGLEVKALDGRPGVHSARYAGEPANDANNVRKLLTEMQKVTSRQARFVTVIAFAQGNRVSEFEGVVLGSIAYEPRGKNGFGYDPLFIPQGKRSTFAEMPAEEKNAISHRAAALAKLSAFLSG